MSSETPPTGAAGDTGAALLRARAAVVADLAARGLDSPVTVDVVEDAMVARQWWVDHWPAGAVLLVGLVATDVQERLGDDHGIRWPECGRPECAGSPVHTLTIEPELSDDPHWVCELTGADLGRLGTLGA